MTYYKKTKRSHTPISDAAVFFSNKENYDRVFDQKQTNLKRNHNQSLEKVKELFNK